MTTVSNFLILVRISWEKKYFALKIVQKRHCFADIAWEQQMRFPILDGKSIYGIGLQKYGKVFSSAQHLVHLMKIRAPDVDPLFKDYGYAFFPQSSLLASIAF